jgi:transcriptional regulator with XRE-family HTH domain
MESTPPRLSFGRYIRHLRESREWTQEDLMRESGLGAGTISKIENDQTNRTQATTEALVTAFGFRHAAALESDYQRFIGGDPQPDTPMRRITDKGLDPRVVEMAERIMKLPPFAKAAIEVVLGAFESIRDEPDRPPK